MIRALHVHVYYEGEIGELVGRRRLLASIYRRTLAALLRSGDGFLLRVQFLDKASPVLLFLIARRLAAHLALPAVRKTYSAHGSVDREIPICRGFMLFFLFSPQI